MSHKRKVQEVSEEEKQLEEFLFGKDIFAVDESESIKINIDKNLKQSLAAWHDDDDDDIDIDLNKTDRLKKLKVENNNKISGTQLSSALQERFATNKLKWAEVQTQEEENDDEEMNLLRQTGGMVEKIDLDSAMPLPTGKVNIKRQTNANIAEPSSKAIHALSFHSSGNLLLVAGQDKHARFFKIDGDTNEKQLTAKFNDMAIRSGKFLGSSSEVVLSGRKPFYFSYDTLTGNVTKIPVPKNRDINSLEEMYVSPEGTKLAFLSPNGHIHIGHGQSKSWIMDLKMNTKVKSAVFVDEMNLITSGIDADIYQWDLRMNTGGRCISRFLHDDGSASSFLSVYNPYSYTSNQYNSNNNHASYQYMEHSYLSVGTESGVVSVFEGNRVQKKGNNGYFDFSGSSNNSSGDNNNARIGGTIIGKQKKSIMNLTTKITSTAFHPSGQILAIASNQKRDQLKFIHLPSCTVFTNWPTERSPFNHIECMEFSPGGGYFAAGNNRGRVLLYKLNHFSNA